MVETNGKDRKWFVVYKGIHYGPWARQEEATQKQNELGEDGQ